MGIEFVVANNYYMKCVCFFLSVMGKNR
jgi:hypothetical protein